MGINNYIAKQFSSPEGLGAGAGAITEEVMQRQSLEVDVVAGATMSSQTILKAIENALTEGMES